MFTASSVFNDGFLNQFRQIQSELESAFGRLPDTADIRQSAHQGFPPTMLSSDEKGVTVRLFAAGFESSDFQVTAENNLLRIDAEKATQDSEEEGARFHLQERKSRRVGRVVTLPDNCDLDSVRAEYKAGVLTVFVARKAQSSPRAVPVN